MKHKLRLQQGLEFKYGMFLQQSDDQLDKFNYKYKFQ